MSTRDYRDCLADMVAYAEAAVTLVAGMSAGAVEADVRTRLALERAIEILGEAAGKVPAEARDRYPDLPWAQMVGLRNRLAHGYFSVDPAVLHKVASEILPSLLTRLREVSGLEGKQVGPGN